MFKRLAWVTLLTLLFFSTSESAAHFEAQTEALPALAEPGLHDVYHTDMTFVDENRGNWTLKTQIWYPAFPAQGTPVIKGSSLLKDVPSDRSGAPYPLIIYSHEWATSSRDIEGVMVHLASYGYVVAAPQHHDARPDYAYVDRPLDILTVLDGLSNIVDGDLAGMIDTDNTGLIGWSQGAETTFQMIGLHYDPAHYESWCAAHPDLPTYDCFFGLQRVSEYRARLGLEDLPDGRWQPFGDQRIRAALAIAPCGFPLTTEDMFAEVSTPVMFVQGTADDICDYELNSVRAYTGLTIDDRYLITLVNGGHGSPTVLQPFATAFFGYYLRGNKDFAAYLTAEQAEKLPGVVWGPYGGD